VEAAGDAGPGERLGVAELLTQGHEPGHLILGEAELVATRLGEREVGDLEGQCGCRGRRGEAHALYCRRRAHEMVRERGRRSRYALGMLRRG
jgi:hypothetical protein